MPPESIFDRTDRPSGLPPELAGKTPEEIAAYYQRREQILIDRARNAAPAEKPASTPEEKIDLFGDPSGSINRVVDRKVGERADRALGAIAPAVINACKVTLRDAHPDAIKFMPEIEQAMTQMSAENQMNPAYWEVAYTNVKGRHADRLVAEAITEDRKVRNPVERPTPKGTDPPKPRELTDLERTVAGKFDLNESEYRDAATRYEETDGALPITVDNRKPRKKAS